MTSPADETLVLITDTNLFLECRPLPDIPWEQLGFAQIELIVTSPVQQELDKHKKIKGGRTYKKALKAWTLLRELVQTDEPHLTIKYSAPTVTLTVMQRSRLQPDLEPTLDHMVPDDAIILRLLEYRQDHPEVQVRLLTHDTGPMMTAKSLGIPFLAIPDDWLLEPEDDPVAKENKQLKTENSRLRAQEPRMEIKTYGSDGAEIDRINFEQAANTPLTKAEIDELMETLQSRFPLVTEFGSPETVPQPEAPSGSRGVRVLEFEPASEKAITSYQDEQYPEWLEKCRSVLTDLNRRLNADLPRPVLRFEVANAGTRPATGSLIRFTGLGGLVLMPISEKDEDDEKPSPPPSLSRPPSPPRGRWKVAPQRGPIDLASLAYGNAGDVIGRIAQTRYPFENMIEPLLPPRIPKHDPDAFYWKDGRPITAREQIALTCDNWRHGVEAETFGFTLYAEDPNKDVTGAVRCEVHAENLSDPVVVTVPVTITRALHSVHEHALGLIEKLGH